MKLTRATEADATGETMNAVRTTLGAGADILIIKAPGTNRFDYFRLVDRIRTGAATPQEVLATQEQFDNHFVDSPTWRAAKSAGHTNLIDLPAH